MEILNKFTVCPHLPYNDSFIIKIFYNSINNCDIVIIREDQQRLWGLDLSITLFNESFTDSENINIGSSPDCIKVVKNYQTKIDLIVPNINGNPYQTFIIPEKGVINIFANDNKEKELFTDSKRQPYIHNFSFDKNKNVIELSSNYGIDTLLFSKVLSSSSKIYSFEFLDKYHKIFKKNLFDNKINDNVVSITDLLFYYSGKILFKKEETETEVYCIRLDDLFFPDIGLIIANSSLNIPILFGAKEMIKKQRPAIYIKNIINENNALPKEVREFDPVVYCMKELGYKTLYLYNDCKILVPV